MLKILPKRNNCLNSCEYERVKDNIKQCHFSMT